MPFAGQDADLMFEEGVLSRVRTIAEEALALDPKSMKRLGTIELRGRGGRRAAIEVVFDGQHRRPYAAAYERKIIVLSGPAIWRKGSRAQLKDDLNLAILHELSHARDEIDNDAFAAFERVEGAIRASAKERAFASSLSAALDKLSPALNTYEMPAVEERSSVLARAAGGSEPVVEVFRRYGLAPSDAEGYLYVRFLHRAEEAMVKGYAGADRDYYRSAGELRARMRTMRQEASLLMKADPKMSAKDAVRLSSSYRMLRKPLSSDLLSEVEAVVVKSLEK